MSSVRLYVAILLSVSLIGTSTPSRAQEAVPGGACTTANAIINSGGPGASGNHLMICNGSTWVSVLDFKSNGSSQLQIAPDTGSCTLAKDGRIRYTSSASPPYEYCDGGTTTWRPFRQPRCTNDATGECFLESPRTNSDADFTATNIRSGTNIMGVTGTYTGGGSFNATVGYFVISQTTWTPDLIAGIEGADALCLNEVQTRDWRYKTDAGTLTAARVRAFLCNGSFCNNPMPNAGYFFARAGDTAVGGVAFKTDSSGSGPGISDNLADSVFLGGAGDYYWSNRAAGTATQWGTTGGTHTNCGGWYSGANFHSYYSAGPQGESGYTSTTGTARWDNSTYNCTTSYKLICMVHPEGYTPDANPCTASATTYNTPGSYTYNVPTGCTSLRVEAYGGGGGGGGGTNSNSGGGGGGSGSGVLNGATLIVGAGGGGGGRFQGGGGGGGYGMTYYSVASGTNLSVTVGGGGQSTCTITGGNGGATNVAGATGAGENSSGATGANRFAGGGGGGGRTTMGCSGAGGSGGSGTPNFGGGAGAGGSPSGCYGNGGAGNYGGSGSGGSCGGSTMGGACNGGAGGAGRGYGQDAYLLGTAGSGANGGAAANSGPGTGGTSCGANGGDGRVVITPLP